jgi:hypothetical protein
MKAVLKNGLICPQEPVPEDWPEGTELEVARSKKRNRNRTSRSLADQWMDRVEAQAAKVDPRNDAVLDKAISAVRLKNKQRAGKRLDLE